MVEKKRVRQTKTRLTPINTSNPIGIGATWLGGVGRPRVCEKEPIDTSVSTGPRITYAGAKLIRKANKQMKI